MQLSTIKTKKNNDYIFLILNKLHMIALEIDFYSQNFLVIMITHY